MSLRNLFTESISDDFLKLFKDNDNRGGTFVKKVYSKGNEAIAEFKSEHFAYEFMEYIISSNDEEVKYFNRYPNMKTAEFIVKNNKVIIKFK